MTNMKRARQGPRAEPVLPNVVKPLLVPVPQGLRRQSMLSVIRHISVAPLLLLLLTECAAPNPYPQHRDQGGIDPSRIPVEPVLWTGIFSCTAYTEGGLPAITWRRIPFRQEGDRLTGLYTFRDSFGYQDSVVFTGTLTGAPARVMVTAVRKDGSSNFTAEMIGNPVSMTGQMMSGTSQRPVRSCTLALTAAG
jgi:hypothetical protein